MAPSKPDPVLVARIVAGGAWVMVVGGGVLAASAVVLLAYVYLVLPSPGGFMPGPLVLLGVTGAFGVAGLLRGRGRLKRLRQGLPVG